MTYTKDNLRQIFQQPFDSNEWQQMLQHFFHVTELRAEPERIDGTTDEEQGHYLGAIDTTDNYRIGLFHYRIQHGNVARKRVGLRNLVKSFVNPNWGEFDAALVVFDSGKLWRLSFVCDIKGESTAPKRYTYVFGEGDSLYNTPVGRFDALLRKGISFENIKEAFSVEALSKEFFEEYREHYADIVEYITGKRYVKERGKWVEKTIHEPCHEIFDQFSAVYKDPEKTVRDYIKKLMGRLVFLQFLQKKEWMGVPAGREDWTGGDTHFLQNKFNEFADKDNFIDGFLEPLFNDLNTNRQDKGDLASPEVGCDIKIPFLNGGLFQLDEEDCTDIRLPQHLLGSVLEFFERYNFTIDENDPNDAQVGVDPEMLGHVFENLLEDKKDKGAFYTPKEIVQYMCRESLIAYLQTDVDDEATKEAIRQFVLTHEADKLDGIRDDIFERLRNVKICDPAIGSGAFPMGLLRELYLCSCAIRPDLEEKASADIKRHIIQNNIYGVDIEKGAVDIARLRFWLSLIVDEETPKFLPNLDFKIMQGNSLLEQYKGVDLSKMTELKKEKEGETQLSMFEDMLDVLRVNLRRKLDEYYNCSDHQHKETLKQEIIDNVKQQLREQSINVDFGELDLATNDQFFLWHTWFYDVFSQGGFDIVIGNPPYGAKLGDAEKQVLRETYNVKTSETAILFIEAGLNFLTSKGIQAYIIPKAFTYASNYGTIRNYVEKELSIIVDCGKAFEKVKLEACIIVNIKGSNGSCYYNLRFIDDMFIMTAIIEKTTKSIFGFYLNGVNNKFIDIGLKVYTNSIFLGSISSNNRGSTLQRDILPIGKYPVVGGKDIDRQKIRGIKGYISNKNGLDSKAIIKRNSVLFQNIVAHITEPYPQIKLIGCVPNRYDVCLVDTINQITISKGYSNKFLWCLLNSKLICWYVYNFIYGQAIRTMHFDSVSTNRIPIKIAADVSAYEKLWNDFIDANTDTSAVSKSIDFLVYQLYGLTYDEVLIVDPETHITREKYEKSICHCNN